MHVQYAGHHETQARIHIHIDQQGRTQTSDIFLKDKVWAKNIIVLDGAQSWGAANVRMVSISLTTFFLSGSLSLEQPWWPMMNDDGQRMTANDGWMTSND
jgi:hypothetical protein